MPRIPIRVEPYSSPQRKQRHFKNKRDQILRALGKASYINGSQFAILWVNPRGETEYYASEVFQSKLGTWFNHDVSSQAKQMVAAADVMHCTPDSTNFHEDVDEMSDRMDTPDNELEDDATVLEKPDQSMEISSIPQSFPQTLRQRLQAPELRRTSSLPVAMQARPEMRTQTPRPQALDMKVIGEQRPGLPQGIPSTANPDYTALTIGNEAEVIAFLETRFKQLQQLVCKIVAKAWIKVIEPKKQTRYPYNKGEESKPTWWPDDVRHKEPDHLMKPERVSLLMTMLRCGRVAVNRLELATAEVAAFIPPDKINLLREIYRVGREEERYKDNEISSETRIYVAASAYISSTDDASPMTASMRGDLTPRSVPMTDAHLALQQSTSQQTFDEEPFVEAPELTTGYAVIQPQQFYYQNGYQQNAAVMSSSSQAQHFQQVQQQQMYAAQQAQARRTPHNIGYANTWPQNVEQNWPDSSQAVQGYSARGSIDNSSQQAVPQHMQTQTQTQMSNGNEGPEAQQFFASRSMPETPQRPQSKANNNRSSPYLPTPLHNADPNFSAARQGVSFSDYLQSPRTAGPEIPAEDNVQYH